MCQHEEEKSTEVSSISSPALFLTFSDEWHELSACSNPGMNSFQGTFLYLFKRDFFKKFYSGLNMSNSKQE